LREQRCETLLLAAAFALTAAPVSAESRGDQALNEMFAGAGRSHALLRLLVQRLPKGADLHRHGEGAIYAEDFLRWAADKEGCLVVEKMALAAGPCVAPASVPVRGLETRDIKLYNDAVDAMSMGRHDMQVGDPAVSGHERFFATFGRFGFAARGERARLVAANREQAAQDRTLYIELMSGPSVGRDLRTAYAAEPWSEADMAGRLERLQPLLTEAVAHGRADTDHTERDANELNGCDRASGPQRELMPSQVSPTLSSCDVAVRYLMTVGREAPPEQVFGRLALAFRMVDADTRFVGVNIAQPEDGPVSLRDYSLHMRMFAFFKSRYPRVPLTLHAGELTIGLTPPRDLRFHIREAVEVAGARRIGHGVDIAYEEDSLALLSRMARERVAVEINLTSNDVILGVRGAGHPLPIYRAAGVPIVLSTDDPGVSRGDLTHEYMRAVTEHGFKYTDLRQVSRDSLTYSFLEGESLWDMGRARKGSACGRLRPPLSPDCRERIERSAKAREQWRLEQAFAHFENELPKILAALSVGG
jgi:adenosine deaminase